MRIRTGCKINSAFRFSIYTSMFPFMVSKNDYITILGKSQYLKPKLGGGLTGALPYPGVWECPPTTYLSHEGVQGSPCRGFGGVPQSILTPSKGCRGLPAGGLGCP